MSEQRWPEVEALLDTALDLPADARTALLDDPTTGDPEIRAEVRRLLGMLDAAEHFLDIPAAQYAAPLVASADDGSDAASPALERIGPYRIIREIGRGGMGAVYLAERDDDHFRMQVALKIVPRGMDSDHALRRFRDERQILASLEHPHIARLLDGGVTADGLPWFALEYVVGIPIDRYCDRHELPLEARLELFCKVCDAVQFAHRNLVVHRDLKPTNILVTEPGAAEAGGVPKLLDFGIAKLLETGTAVSEPLTRTGVRVMTPEYASPEQVRGELITTATDVYSLGVLLYELLAGRRPYRLSDRSARQVEHAVCELEPEPPSAALSRAGEVAGDGILGAYASPESVSLSRATTPERLRRRLRGDLDTIALMTLRKEPERRYASAEQLAADIRRHLSSVPVSARRDSAGYRAGKFLRRHRMGVTAAVVVVLSIFAGLGGTVWQARQATREAARSAEVKAFLVSLFEAEQPEVSRGRELTARELLDQGAARIDADLVGQPAVQAELLSVLAATYLALGLIDVAQPLVDRALALRRRMHGEQHADVAASRHQAARILLERGDFDAAEHEYREVLALLRRLRGGSHPEVARTTSDLARVLSGKGAYEEAEPLYREALEIDRSVYGHASREVATGLSNLGVLLMRRGKHTEAVAAHREALELRRARLEADHPDVITSLFNLAAVLDDLGDRESEQMYREVLERRRRIYRDAHPVLATTLENLAGVLSRRGEVSEADRYSRESLEMKRRLFGEEHPEVAAALNNLAVLQYRAGDLEGAAQHMTEALGIWRGSFGDVHPNVAAALNNLGGILNEIGDHRGAIPLLIEALAMRRELLGPAHPSVAQTLRNLGIAGQGIGDDIEAEAHFREALAIYRSAFPGAHLSTAEVLLAYGSLLIERRQPAEAEPLLREALAIRRETLSQDDWRIGQAAAALGHSLVALGDHAAAEPILLAGYETLRSSAGGQQSAALPRTLEQLEALYRVTHRDAEAARVRELPRH